MIVEIILATANFDECQEVTFISRYHNHFALKVRQFVTIDL